MTCKSCADAISDPTRDDYRTPCFGCQARAAAAVGIHVEAMALNTITPDYRRKLEMIFGDRWRDGHEEVKRWAQRINQANATRRAKAT